MGLGCCDPNMMVCDYEYVYHDSWCSGWCPPQSSCQWSYAETRVVEEFVDCEGGCPGACLIVETTITTGYYILDCDCMSI